MKKSRPSKKLDVSAPLREPKKEDGKPSLVPKLRFPEFRGADGWTEKPLKAAAEINPVNAGLPESFIYIDLESVEAGKLKAKNRIAREGAPSRAQRLVERKDIIYQVVRPYQRNNLLCEFDDDENYVASTGYAQLRAKGSNRFLYQSIHTDSFVGRVIAKCTGSNYPAINSSDLAEIQLPIPPTLPEQKKIAECLRSVDELMAAQGRKVDALKTHKKGLMQQLFPREGETQPRLRFPEFQNAGAWEVRRVDEKGAVLAGKALAVNAAGPQRPYLRTKNVLDGAIDLSDVLTMPMTEAEFDRFEILDGDVLLNEGQSLELVGRTSIYRNEFKGRCAMQNQLLRFRAFASTSGEFAAQYFRKCQKDGTFANVATKTTSVAHLGSSRFSALELSWPSQPEQHRIASCLSSLDALITAETQKLEALKTHKRGLMQQLFPSPEAQNNL
jgi:type I restriction enzyme, S subunit